MRTILQINASLFTDDGQSSRLANQLVAQMRAQFPDAELIVRDLGNEQIPHLDAARFGAFLAPPESRTPAQQAVLNYSDALISELRRADTIVLGLPMYNFGVPSQLKAWFDHVARAGVTFKYTEKGAVGLLAGKKAFVLATRGGKYAGTDGDNQTPYVRQFLSFLGIFDVEFIFAEGLAMGDAAKSQSLAAAQDAIHRAVSLERAAA